MLRRFKSRQNNSAQYNFYVWRGGSYIHIDGGVHASDGDAAVSAQAYQEALAVLDRPATLNVPHLHVIREDGIHILTLEVPLRSAA